MTPSSNAIDRNAGSILLGIAFALGLVLLFCGHAFPLLLGAVTIAAWFGGARLGVVTTLVLMGMTGLGVRSRPTAEARSLGLVQIASFAGIGLLITGLTECFLAARRRAEGDAEARRQSEERYRLAVAGTRDGIWDWDLKTGRVYLSRRLEEMVGAWEEEPGGTLAHFSSRIHPDDRDRVMAALRDHLERRFPYDLEFRLRAAGGEYRWFHACGQSVWGDDGRATRMACSLGDITARKTAEAELVEAKEAAEAAGRSKDLFLAMLSHELRTPLTPALLGVSGLIEDPATPAALRGPLESAMRGIALEARLVDDLLDVTRIGAGKLRLDPERVDVHALVENALDACRGEIRAGEIRIELALEAEDPLVVADPARLQQVLWNLIKNAAKFAPGGTVVIRSRNVRDCGCQSAAGCLAIEVEDDGAGIEPDLLPRVFDAFAQGDGGIRRRLGGLGLGLAISRSIVEAHGGRLRVRSDGQGRGTTFILELANAAPLAASHAGLPATAAAGGPTMAGLRLLVVEDDIETMRVLALLLRARKAEVATATTLEEARRALAADRRFDLLISDLSVADGSGLDLIRWLRTFSGLPALALTGYGMEDDVRICLEAGFQAHLTKPIEFRRLEAAIRDAVQTPPRSLAGAGAGLALRPASRGGSPTG